MVNALLLVTIGLPNLISVRTVRNDIVEIHLSEGHVEHHTVGHARSDEKVIIAPLDVDRAMRPDVYRVNGTAPIRVARKSKGTDFAWFVDRWAGDHAENSRPDHVKDHWIYLTLPKPLREGQTVAISAAGVIAAPAKFTFSAKSTISEAVHVNLLGYAPDSPAKFGYVYAWLGDAGPMPLSDAIGRPFHLIESATNKVAFSGKTRFRKPAANAETEHVDETPNGSFVAADVLDCDFSVFAKPGTYRLSVDGIGCSQPFKIDPDAYRTAFRTTTRGLYHNRSGIALTKPYTTFERPAPHNPLVTPGFKGKLQYTASRMIDWQNWEYSPADVPAIKAGLKGPIDVWGWYQDAGDWDGYYTHIQVAQELMLAYLTAPQNFSAHELNLPESANGIPDILNEAAWLPRFGHRLRHILLAKGWGTGGIGLRVCGDHFGSDTGPKDVGRGSWLDVDRTWIVSGEDPLCTYQYAGAAAQLARCLEVAKRKDPAGVDWRTEARESYAWAQKNTRPGDEGKLRTQRAYASAAMFALTGEKAYEDQLSRDTTSITPTSEVWDANVFPLAAYLMAPQHPTGPLAARFRAAILHTAESGVATAEKRALRWAGAWGMPMLVGQQTTPMVEPVIVAYAISTGAERSKYRGVLTTTADYFLGTNPLNMTWVSGLGPRNPVRAFHMDSWYRNPPALNAGIVPYGIWRKDRDLGQGPWDHDWANKSVYPKIDAWPGGERWFSNQCSPMASEFTVWQNIAPSACLYGVLCGRAKP